MQLEKIKAFIIKNYLLLILLVIAFLVIFIFWLFYSFTIQNLSFESKVSHIVRLRENRILDGKLVPIEESQLRPIAVMLENHSESRPVAGLEYASIIYEIIIEGDITRFLAIFDPKISAKKIGPVRSVRPFFVELAEEYNVVLFHAGGSQDAMYKLTYSSVYNINEISGDGIYFWRDSSREMPHNLFTSISLMERAIKAKGEGLETKADFEPWLFKKDNPKSRDYPDYPTGEKWEKAHEIKVDFNNNLLYQVEYKYNEEDNNYTRYLANEIHKTERGIILKAKNIIIQHVAYDIIDDYGRLDINITGRGQAQIYKDGRMIEAYWLKPKNGRTLFYDLGNREIKFNKGVIWVELLFN